MLVIKVDVICDCCRKTILEDELMGAEFFTMTPEAQVQDLVREYPQEIFTNDKNTSVLCVRCK